MSEAEIARRRESQRELKNAANPFGEKLLACGFAKPAAGDDPAPWQASPVVGPATARSVIAWRGSPLGQATILRLKSLGIHPARAEAAFASGNLQGKAFVLTGTLPNLTRDQAASKIRAAGGSVASSVSRKTDFLIAGAEAGSKLDRAMELGVAVLDEVGFLALLGETTNTPSPKTPASAQASLL